jgi:hypothetical protein
MSDVISGKDSAFGENCYLTLVHYPTLDKEGKIITSAITALDLHDFSRLARTYGLGGVLAQTNLPQQIELMENLLGHWKRGTGGEINPDRKRALEILTLVDSVKEASELLEKEWGETPLLIATSARSDGPKRLDYPEARARLKKSTRPVLLLFGTAWGMAEELMEACDWVLSPIGTPGGYNHLSVRSAASITVDRLFGQKS